jgi:hypothetical protein
MECLEMPANMQENRTLWKPLGFNYSCLFFLPLKAQYFTIRKETYEDEKCLDPSKNNNPSIN